MKPAGKEEEEINTPKEEADTRRHTHSHTHETHHDEAPDGWGFLPGCSHLRDNEGGKHQFPRRSRKRPWPRLRGTPPGRARGGRPVTGTPCLPHDPGFQSRRHAKRRDREAVSCHPGSRPSPRPLPGAPLPARASRLRSEETRTHTHTPSRSRCSSQLCKSRPSPFLGSQPLPGDRGGRPVGRCGSRARPAAQAAFPVASGLPRPGARTPPRVPVAPQTRGPLPPPPPALGEAGWVGTWPAGRPQAQGRRPRRGAGVPAAGVGGEAGTHLSPARSVFGPVSSAASPAPPHPAQQEVTSSAAVVTSILRREGGAGAAPSRRAPSRAALRPAAAPFPFPAADADFRPHSAPGAPPAAQPAQPPWRGACVTLRGHVTHVRGGRGYRAAALREAQ